jgi:hypothetical protein
VHLRGSVSGNGNGKDLVDEGAGVQLGLEAPDVDILPLRQLHHVLHAVHPVQLLGTCLLENISGIEEVLLIAKQARRRLVVIVSRDGPVALHAQLTTGMPARA